MSLVSGGLGFPRTGVIGTVSCRWRWELNVGKGRTCQSHVCHNHGCHCVPCSGWLECLPITDYPCWSQTLNSSCGGQPALTASLSLLTIMVFLSNAFWVSRFPRHSEMASISEVYNHSSNSFLFIKQDLTVCSVERTPCHFL